MHHTSALTDLLSYVLWGGGAWDNRWQGTGHDWVLATVSMLGCVWLLCESVRYAWAAGKPIEGKQPSKHDRQLRYVFAQQAAINAISMLLVWLVPAYYVAAILCLLNAYQMGRLNRAKLSETIERELAEGRLARERMEKLRCAFGTEVVETTIDNSISAEDLVSRIQATIGEAKGIATELRCRTTMAGG